MGETYPDIELLPAIARIFSVTLDELCGMPDEEKEKRASEAFDALNRTCRKKEPDTDEIVSLLRDIRRNYLDCSCSWRLWKDSINIVQAYRRPEVLPEIRLAADICLERNPVSTDVLETMAMVEDDEHIGNFLKKHAACYDISERQLLYLRAQLRRKPEKFEPESRYKLFKAFDDLLNTRNLIGLDNSKDDLTLEFRAGMLGLIRDKNEPVDMWADERLNIGFALAGRLASEGKTGEALAKLGETVSLLEETMKISAPISLGTSCSWLDGMKWEASELWHTPDNNPDSAKERTIYIDCEIGGMVICYVIVPSRYYRMLMGRQFDALRETPGFKFLLDRVAALIIKESPDA